MFVDKNGVCVDVIMDGNVMFNCSNYGCLYEYYFNVVFWDILIKLCNWMGIFLDDKYIQYCVDECYYSNCVVFDQCWDYFMGYYEIFQLIVYYDLCD